jgi:hypothetical protein
MRCYFLRKDIVAGVTFLRADSDAGLVRQAEAALRTHPQHGFDGFEVWAGERLVCRRQARSVGRNPDTGRKKQSDEAA